MVTQKKELKVLAKQPSLLVSRMFLVIGYLVTIYSATEDTSWRETLLVPREPLVHNLGVTLCVSTI